MNKTDSPTSQHISVQNIIQNYSAYEEPRRFDPFWVEKIKLVIIFIFPELDFVQKADVPPWTQKELKEQRINLWITGNDKVAQGPWPDTRESETVKD